MARKQKNIHYLYKTTCLVTERYYIGMHSTCNLDDGYMGSGKRLRYSIRKYGVENHKKEIIEFFDNRELLIEAEKKAITPEMITDKNCMNLKEGGFGGFTNEQHEKDFQEGKVKWLVNAWKDESYREKQLPVLKENVQIAKRNGSFLGRQNFKGKTHTNKTKKLISEKAKERTGDKNSQYGTCWIMKGGVNKKIKKEELNKYQQEGWVKGRTTI